MPNFKGRSKGIWSQERGPSGPYFTRQYPYHNLITNYSMENTMNQTKNQINKNLGWVSYDTDDFIPKEYFIFNKENNNSIHFQREQYNKLQFKNIQKLFSNFESIFKEKIESKISLSDFTLSQTWGIDSDSEFAFITEENHNFLVILIESYQSIVVKIYSHSFDIIDSIKESLDEILPHKSSTCTIRWYYKEGPVINDIKIDLNTKNLPCTEMYPFLREKGLTLEEYYDSYKESESCVLVLIGPPGTGKTSFIKGLLNHCSYNAMTSSEPEVLYSDHMFIKFITESSINSFIVEDADNFLAPREDNNPVMHKILSASDGIISIPNKKKMIFSTNLESIDHIDAALIRPGRCFDILKFSELSNYDAKVVAEKYGIENVPDKDTMTLAELMTQTQNRKNEDYKLRDKKIGFL